MWDLSKIGEEHSSEDAKMVLPNFCLFMVVTLPRSATLVRT